MPKNTLGEQFTIGDIEEMVGKKASNVIVHEREIICVFSGGMSSDGSLAADVRFHIKRW